MTKYIQSVEVSREVQQKLFAEGYWWLGNVRDIYLPPHKEYYLIFKPTPSRIHYQLSQFANNHEIPNKRH